MDRQAHGLQKKHFYYLTGGPTGWTDLHFGQQSGMEQCPVLCQELEQGFDRGSRRPASFFVMM